MQIVVKNGHRFVVLPGALLHEEDHEQVTIRAKRTGEKFSEALANYVKELREYLKTGEGIVRETVGG